MQVVVAPSRKLLTGHTHFDLTRLKVLAQLRHFAREAQVAQPVGQAVHVAFARNLPDAQFVQLDAAPIQVRQFGLQARQLPLFAK
jgi:hypothetical protein